MTQQDFVKRAIDVLATRGKIGPLLAGYLYANCEEFTPKEVRGWLKNVDCAIRELREELRAIES